MIFIQFQIFYPPTLSIQSNDQSENAEKTQEIVSVRTKSVLQQIQITDIQMPDTYDSCFRDY